MSKEKILRVSSFVYHVGDQEYKLPKTPDSEYIVDDSSFVPISEAIRQLGTGMSSAGKADLMYDFQDGKDDGRQIPFSRSSQFKDLAELSTEVQNEIDDINSKVSQAKAEEEFRNKIKADLAPASTDTSAS